MESARSEDWDQELCLDDGDSEATAPMLNGAPRGNVVDTDMYSSASASLLDHLDSYSNVEKSGFGVRTLPRPSVLFSNYAMRQQAVNDSSELSSIKSFTSMTLKAPGSAADMIVWLQNLCTEISCTAAVVARPAPAHFGTDAERERSPSEEVALEKELRMAEVAYCNGNLHACGAHTKNIFRRLEKPVQPHGALRVISFGDGHSRPSTFDDDLRSYQCGGRLARLMCRLVQRYDECSAPEVQSTATTHGHYSKWTSSLDASDVAAFRRGAALLLNDIHDHALRARGKLIIDEALVHLALVIRLPMS
jgi:hypothetical protein